MSSSETTVEQMKEAPHGKIFQNQKFYRLSFKNRDLANAKFQGAALIGCDFSGADLSFANFEGANCWEANFTGAKLYATNFKDAILAKSIMHPKDCFRMTITLCCDTVEQMDIDEKWQTVWLFLSLKMKLPSDDLAQAVIGVIGREKYMQLMHIFENRIA